MHTPNTPQQHGRLARRAMLAGIPTISAALLAGCSTVDRPQAAQGNNGGGGPLTASLADEHIREIVDGRTVSLGFAPPILSEFYTQVEKAAFNRMAEYEERYGIQWQWERQGALEDSHSGTESVGIVQGYISRGFDAVFVCSAAPGETMQELYATGAEAGVDFYQFNSTEELYQESQDGNPTGGMNTVSNIGYDDRWQSGYIAGQYIAEKLGGEGTIIQIMGPSGSPWTVLRQEGFDRAIAEYPGLEIVGKADGGYVRDQGLNAAQDLLTSFSDVNAVYAENEDMALGASQAIDTAGLKHWDGEDGIITIGADGLLSGMQAIRAGSLTATVNVNSVEMGHRMIETFFNHEILGMAVNQFIRIPTDVVDASNVDWHQAVIEESMAGSGDYSS